MEGCNALNKGASLWLQLKRGLELDLRQLCLFFGASSPFGVLITSHLRMRLRALLKLNSCA